MQEQTQIVEMSVGANTVTEFANIMGLGHMDQDTFLAAVRCCAIQKELLADYAGKRFVPAGTVDYDVVTAGSEDKRPPSPAGQGPSAQQVAELVQMLAATNLENERLRAASIPRLNRQQLERLIEGSLPYQWMLTLAVALKAYSATDANWDAHELAKPYGLWYTRSSATSDRAGLRTCPSCMLREPQRLQPQGRHSSGWSGRREDKPWWAPHKGGGGGSATPVGNLDSGHANARK